MNDQLPPHSIEAETSFIGCLIAGEAEHLNAALSDAREEMFYDIRHVSIFNCITKMVADGVPVGVITVCTRLQASGMLAQVGSAAYVASCLDACPSPSLWFHFFEIIRQKHQLRKLSSVCASIAAGIHETSDTDALIDLAERQVLTVRGSDVKGETTMKELVLAVTDAMQRDMDGTHLRGLPTNLRTLDSWTRGLKPQNLIVIAARPSVGKSALAMQFAAHVALEAKLPVAIFSLEMSGQELTERAIKQRSRVEDTRRMTNDELRALTTASSAIAASPMFILDDGAVTIGQIQARARRLHQRHTLALIVVDYIQLVRGSGRKENRTVEIGEVSMGLKALAKELNVPVLVLAQLNRDCERDNRPPRLSDLRESGSIEQDADIVLLLHTKEDNGNTRLVEMRVEKNRGSRRGLINLVFNGPLTEFREAEIIEREDQPRRQHND